MTSITFYFFLIPILAIVLLGVNFIFATHNPYQEKNSAFECGFHSFLGQNRMQFNISFYIFGLLFLLFDLEILLIYPYPTSAYFNALYGLCIMLIFFILLTLGFVFELGKNALKIDSRQYEDLDIAYKAKKDITLQSNIIKINYVSLLLIVVSLYLFISYCLGDIIYCGPIEEAVDVAYLKDQIYSIQCAIKDNNLNLPNRLLTSEAIELKKECQEALRETINTLKEIDTEPAKAEIENAKRTAEVILDDAQESNKRPK